MTDQSPDNGKENTGNTNNGGETEEDPISQETAFKLSEEMEPDKDAFDGGQKVNVTGSKIETQNIIIKGSIERDKVDTLSPPTASQCYTFRKDTVAERASRCYYRVTLVDQLHAQLRRNRIAVLLGPARTGKAELAFPVCQKLKKLHLNRLLLSPEDCLITNLRHFSGKDFSGSLVVLKDPFHKRNRDFSLTFRRMTPHRLDRLRQLLVASNTFLMLTADTELLSANVDKLDRLGLHIPYQPPEKGKLTTWLRSEINRTYEGLTDKDQNPDRARLAEAQEKSPQLIERYPKIPVLLDFVNHGLTSFLIGKRSWDEAVREEVRLRDWLLEDCAQDPVSWQAVTALTLCLSDTSHLVLEEGYCQVRRLFTPFFRKITRGQRSSDKLQHLINDRALQDRIRATSHSKADQPGMLIGFQTSDTSEQLWIVLIEECRTFLFAFWEHFAPRLGELPLPAQSYITMALGRVVHLLSPNTFFWFLDKITSEQQTDHQLARLSGLFLRGILSWKDTRKTQWFLKQYNHCVMHSPKGGELLRSFSWVNVEDFSDVMERIYLLLQAMQHNTPEAEDLGSLFVTLRNRIFWELLQERNMTKLPTKEIRDQLADKLKPLFWQKLVLQFSQIVIGQRQDETFPLSAGLCFHDIGCFVGLPHQVMGEFNKWVRTDRHKMGRALCLILFHYLYNVRQNKQLFNLFGKTRVPNAWRDPLSPSNAYIDSILYQIAENEENQRTFQEGFVWIFRYTHDFPMAFREEMEQLFIKYLIRIIRESLLLKITRHACVGFVAGLLDLLVEEDRNMVADCLNDASERADPNSGWFRFLENLDLDST